MARGGEPTLITSVQRALRLLEAVSEQPSGTTAKNLSRRTGIALRCRPRTTCCAPWPTRATSRSWTTARSSSVPRSPGCIRLRRTRSCAAGSAR
uniref:helix-turn-helix domain-containing protein n=1 Tax=Saccharopolyspora oryzae TaxID=2997343 RepID=UPI0038CD6E1C